mgnify:CR=1 FL=1
MRLPHHAEIVAALRRPTLEEPWRVLLSGCLAGAACGVDGTDYGLGERLPERTREIVVSVGVLTVQAVEIQREGDSQR